MSATNATSAILKSLISAVCYCLCGTQCEKERDTRECPRCHGDPADSHTSRFLSSSLRVVLNPPPSAPELELLAPIFGFLLGMLFTICESLLNTSTLELIYVRGYVALCAHWTWRQKGRDISGIFDCISCYALHLDRIESGKNAIDCFFFRIRLL